MSTVTFLIDGFNLYHSVLRLKRDTGFNTKWLDLASLCKSYFHLFGKGSTLESIFYFSAVPYYLSQHDPAKIQRDQTYLKCLESTGIKVIFGRFKEKDTYCPKCRSLFLKHEEKETDVSIGITHLELFFTQVCDIAVIVSGDTDLSPAVRKCQSLFPRKRIIFAFPYARKNKELFALTPGSFSINAKQYIRYQFPNPVILKDGQEIYKPGSW
jgi:uncharacterized LabA/DUF88 family protein